MKILVLTQYPVPYGMAQTNRILAICKGLHEAGADVKIIVTKPTEKYGHVRNEKRAGIFEGVKFQYASSTTIRSSNPAARIMNTLAGFIRSFTLVVQENKRQKVDVVLMGYTNPLLTLLHYLLSRMLKFKFVQERSEYPFISLGKNLLGRISLVIYLHLICKLFDGFIVITKALKKYFAPYLQKNTPTYLLPILVEPDRFNIEVTDEKAIVYCGSMAGTKDGVNLLIQSFGKISAAHPDVKLVLIGETRFSGFEKLQQEVDALGLTDRVEFTGRIERDKLPESLAKATVLALSRPTSKQAEGGFPTKLGEYLATGKPVAVTNVGEISDFLRHHENAFIANPDSADSFAEVLDYVFANKAFAEEVGRQGAKLAHNEFNYRVQGAHLLKWFEQLKTS